MAVSEILNSQYKRAQGILAEHRGALDKVAAALLEHETLEGRHVLEIIKHGEIQSPIVAMKPPKLPPADATKTTDKAVSEASSGPAGTPAPSPA
jgi:cell division protease FtsH